MVNAKKLKAIFVYTLVYGLAIGAAWATLEYTSSAVDNNKFTAVFSTSSWSIPTRALLADLVACFLIYLACILFNSFSINDLYWTLQATCLSIYYFMTSRSSDSKIDSSNYLDYIIKRLVETPLKSLLVLVLVNVWSLRLSYNLLSTGLHHVSHEDWRFVQYRAQWRPRLVYFLIGLFAFIILPNLIVYVACLPVYFVLTATDSAASMKLLDWVALLVTLLGNSFKICKIYSYLVVKKIII